MSSTTDFLDDIDIDANFYHENFQGVNRGLGNDEYFDISKFNATFNTNMDKDLKIIHLNIRSLPRNGNSLIIYLEMLKIKFDVICLSETWLNEGRLIENMFPEFDQYHSMRPADLPPGGGVAVFVRKKFHSYELSELSCNTNCIESIFVKLKINNEEIAIASCYRKPESFSAQTFINSLTEKISSIRSSNTCIITGDFNFNLLQIDNNLHSSSFLDAMLSLGLINTISKPTRNISSSISLLDNIFVSNSMIFSSGLLYCDISDHFPVFAIVKGALSNSNENERIQYRIINDLTLSNLRNSMATRDFSEVLQSDDLDFAMEKLDQILLSEFNQHCPILSKKITKKDRMKPWINYRIKNLMKFRTNKYISFKRDPRLTTWEDFKLIRNYVTKQIVDAKKLYFSNLFNLIKNDMKKVWTVLNGLVRPGRNRNSNEIKSLLIDGRIFSDDQEISNILNEHFSTVGSRISSEFEGADHHIHSLSLCPNSLFLKMITPGDVVRIIDNMKNKPCNFKFYPIKVIKELKFILSSVLSCLINKSLNTGYFPSKLKIARVIPLHKGGSKSELNNYRPISILPIFSKNFERIVYNQLYSFLEKFKLLNPNQFGFRKNKSTTQAVLNTLEYIYNKLDQSFTVISIFLDFSKAFDCLDHNLLLTKLYHLGIRGLPYRWFESYLSGRKQFVSVNDKISNIASITHGVPQGSILGPLLFLIFINDFPNVNPFFKFSLFADDSTLTCKFNTSNEVIIKNQLETELKIVYGWLKINKIKINYEKSNFIIFSYGKKYNLSRIQFGNDSICSTENTKFLGIIIDKNLNFKSHTSHISNKISKIVGLLFRLNNILPVEALTTLFSTLFVPHVLYGIEVWFGVLQSNNDRIFILQKKAIRAVNCLPYNSHTNQYFKSMKILKLEDLYKLRVLQFMFEADSPASHADTHSHDTRNRENLIIPRFNRAKTQSTIFYQGILLWNNLPDVIKTTQYTGAFKNGVKSFLLDSY